MTIWELIYQGIDRAVVTVTIAHLQRCAGLVFLRVEVLPKVECPLCVGGESNVSVAGFAMGD